MSRIYANSYETISEIFRDLDQMGTIVKPKSMQNKNIEGNPEYYTKEIQNYVYTLVNLGDTKPLFLFEDTREWAEAEFIERVKTKFENPGSAYKIRLDTWKQFLNEVGKFDYTYNDRINRHQNLARISDELDSNPDTRQAWLPIFFPEDVWGMGGKQRIPCSLGYYFMVREGQLNLTYIQRSADAVIHFGNDIFLAWQMLKFISKRTGYKRGTLTHHIFSLHAYQKDWHRLKDGIHNLIK